MAFADPAHGLAVCRRPKTTLDRIFLRFLCQTLRTFGNLKHPPTRQVAVTVNNLTPSRAVARAAVRCVAEELGLGGTFAEFA